MYLIFCNKNCPASTPNFGVGASDGLFKNYFLFGDDMPRSRQIFFAKKLSISMWRGTVEDFLSNELKKTLCLAPSLKKNTTILKKMFN